MAVNFRGYLFQDDGDAVSGATVQLLETGTTTVEASTTTDSDGLWYFSEGDQDRYDVKITSGTSVRYIRWDDQISVKELDVRNNTGNTTPAATFTNLTNNAANQVAVFSGANSTKADNDEIYLSFKMHDSAGNLDEFARMTVVATDVTTTTEDGQIEFDVMKAGTLTKVWTVTSSTAGAMSFDMNVDALTIGSGADTDISLTFDANSADGVITWMEDEDYFKFSDDILMNSTERINFYDTAIYIYSSTDGQLDLVADTEIQIAATTIDINGAVALNGAVTGATNITLSGELDAATLDLSSSADIAGDLVLSGGADGALQFTNAGENSIKIPDNQASALIIEEADNAYITFVTTDSSEAITVAKATTFSAGIANAGTISAGTWNGTAIASGYIAGDAITGAKIADDAIDSEHYTDGSIDTAHLAADVITGAKIADDAIDSEHYTDGSIDNAHLADDAVDSDEIAAGAIDTAHIADNQVTLAKMAGLARGKIIYGDSSGDPAALAVGTAGYALAHDGTDIAYTNSLLAADYVIGEDSQTKIDFETANEIHFDADNAERVKIDSTGLNIVSGSLETATIDYTDGDNAMTIADGGGVTFPQATTFSSTISTATGSTIGNLTLANGSITDSGGALDFGNETLTTTGMVYGKGGITIGAGGNEFSITESSDDITIKSLISDKDLKISGNDGGSNVDALSFDMSASGAATFGGQVGIGVAPAVNHSLHLYRSGSNSSNLLRLENNDASSTDAAYWDLRQNDNGELVLWRASTAFMDFSITGAMFINETANTFMAEGPGLTINQGAADDEILTFKSSDVGHGMTNSANTEADTYGAFGKVDGNANSGGLQIDGYSEAIVGLALQGKATTNNTTDGTGARGAVEIEARLRDGVTTTAYAAADNALVVRNNETAEFIVKGDGELYSNQSATVATFDEYDDARLARALDLTHGVGVIDSKFDDFIEYNHEKLADLKLVGRDEDGSPNKFVNITRMQRLHNGAIWQGYERQMELQERVEELETKLLALEGAK